MRCRACAPSAAARPRRRGGATASARPRTGHRRRRDRRQSRVDLARAHLDELTGVYTRGLGQEILRHEIDRAHRVGEPFTLAFLDVDGLKALNDREGHAAGDEFLRAVADAIRLKLRSYDPVVRMGGDEFVCGFADTDAVAAGQRVAEIQAALAESHPDATFSAGIAELRARRHAGRPDRAGRRPAVPREAQADSLMHTAAATGRRPRRAGKAERALLMSERARWAAAWAETHAERGDYEYALKWLDMVRKSGGLTPQQISTGSCGEVSSRRAGRPDRPARLSRSDRADGAVLASRLGVAQAHVGHRDQLLDAGGVVRVDHPADAGGQRDAVQIEAGAQVAQAVHHLVHAAVDHRRVGHGTRTANSSPPSRATMSRSRTHDSSARAARHSTRSPIW